MPVIHHHAAGSLAGHAVDGALQLLGERRGHAFVDEQVVGRDADLTGVEKLAPGDFLRRFVEIGSAVDDDRRLSPQLERHRRQMFRGGSHDRAADRRFERLPWCLWTPDLDPGASNDQGRLRGCR